MNFTLKFQFQFQLNLLLSSKKMRVKNSLGDGPTVSKFLCPNDESNACALFDIFIAISCLLCASEHSFSSQVCSNKNKSRQCVLYTMYGLCYIHLSIDKECQVL